jgi:UDP-2,3-diacylglucosamine pyrophosphatase LpxH
MPEVRSIFISDVHLGTRACQAERLLDFLREYSAQHLFLVGDIIDFWSMSRSIHWNTAQNTVVQKVLRRARHGEKVILVPGNHDEALRDYCESAFGDIHIANEYVHETADGRRYLLIHGDDFDQVTRYHKWVAVLGDMAYNLLVRANVWLSRLRRLLGIAGYWSLASYAKRRVKSALQFIFDFEDSVMHHVRERGHWVGVVRPRRHRNDGDNGDDGQEWTVPGWALPNYPGVRLGTPAWRRRRTCRRWSAPMPPLPSCGRTPA